MSSISARSSAPIERLCSSELMQSDPTGSTFVASLFLSSRLRPDHVDVQLRHDLFHRHRRVVGEIARAPEAALLAGVPNEDERALRLLPFGERFRERHDRHGAGAVVVRAVPDAIVFRARRDAPRRARAARAVVAARNLAFGVSDVIVVRPERHVRVLQLRIATFDDADDVLGELGAHNLIVRIDVERDRRARDAELRQLLLRGCLAFQLVWYFTGA